MPRTLPVLCVVALLTGCEVRSAPPGEAPVPGAAERVEIPAGPGSDWPTLLGENGDGISSETGLSLPWPAAGLTKLWEAPAGSGYAPPIVVSNWLYFADQIEQSTRLRAFNAVTGEQIWRQESPTDYEDNYGYEPGPRAAPVTAGDRVFVYTADGKLSVYAATTGAKGVEVDTRARYRFHQNCFGVGSVPLVVGNQLIVAIGGSPPGRRPADLRDARGNGSCLVAFDLTTGDECWRAGDDLASYSSPILRTLNGKPTVLYFGRGGLSLVDPAAGKLTLFYPYRSKLLESVNAANPVVVGNEILLSECYENGSVLLRLTDDKLIPVWSDAAKDRGEKSLQAHWCTPIVAGDFVYGCHGRNPTDAELRCLNWRTGEVMWRERRTTRCTLVRVDNHLLSFSEQGQLRVIQLNAEKYTEVARWDVPDLGYPTWAPPVISRGRLYLRGRDADQPGRQKLVCYELMPRAK